MYICEFDNDTQLFKIGEKEFHDALGSNTKAPVAALQMSSVSFLLSFPLDTALADPLWKGPLGF